jgi:hypothetical protein
VHGVACRIRECGHGCCEVAEPDLGQEILFDTVRQFA